MQRINNKNDIIAHLFMKFVGMCTKFSICWLLIQVTQTNNCILVIIA